MDQQPWKTRRRAWRKWLAAVFLLVALALGINEYFFLFPLTPFCLDTAGRTRLPPAPNKIRVLLVGDTLLADAARPTIAARGYDYLLAGTRHLVRQADLAVGNLEGPISTSGTPDQDKRWAYRADPASAVALSKAGFHLMNLANNHIGDCGEVGIRETWAALQEAGIQPYGAGLHHDQAYGAAVHTVQDVRLAFLGFLPARERVGERWISRQAHGWAPGQAGAALARKTDLRASIRRARARADLVVVSFHMGQRYQSDPTPLERDLCHQAIDAGADAVVNHGPHILGPLELYRGRPIFHSVGNFAFGSGNIRARFSLMAFLLIDQETKQLQGIEALPIYTVNYNPWVRFQSKVLTGMVARRILEDLRERSGRLGAAWEVAREPFRLRKILFSAEADLNPTIAPRGGPLPENKTAGDVHEP